MACGCLKETISLCGSTILKLASAYPNTSLAGVITDQFGNTWDIDLITSPQGYFVINPSITSQGLFNGTGQWQLTAKDSGGNTVIFSDLETGNTSECVQLKFTRNGGNIS